MSIQNAYTDKMNAQIRKAEAEMDRLKAKADEAEVPTADVPDRIDSGQL